PTNRYQMVAVTERFLSDYRMNRQFNDSKIRSDLLYARPSGFSYAELKQQADDVTAFRKLLDSSRNYTELSPNECRKNYGTELLSRRRNLVVVLGGLHELDLYERHFTAHHELNEEVHKSNA